MLSQDAELQAVIAEACKKVQKKKAKKNDGLDEELYSNR